VREGRVAQRGSFVWFWAPAVLPKILGMAKTIHDKTAKRAEAQNQAKEPR
jgi:hypothetical protein